MPVGYILFIDEAGDDGIDRVEPIDPNGASEWLVLGGVLIREPNRLKPVEWVREFKKGIKGAQKPDLHFYDLSDYQRIRASQYLAELPIRCFVYISNKKNMRGYQNPRTFKRNVKNAFYNWALRLLLERASHYCVRRTQQDYNETRTMRIELASRGGYSLEQFKAYLHLIRQQSEGGGCISIAAIFLGMLSILMKLKASKPRSVPAFNWLTSWLVHSNKGLN